MESKELMIGSLTNKGVVVSFYEYGIHVGLGKTFNFSDLEPVIITEKILIAFNFRKEKDHYVLDPCFSVRIVAYNQGNFFSVQFFTRTIHTDFVPIYTEYTFREPLLNSVHNMQGLYRYITNFDLSFDIEKCFLMDQEDIEEME